MKRDRRYARRAGSVYERRDSPFWWITFSLSGKKFYENTKIPVSETGSRKRAEDELKKKLHDSNRYAVSDTHNVTVADLAADYITDYVNNGRKSIGHAKSRWNEHLKPFFGICKASRVTGELVERYKQFRLEEKASNATVNRELAALRRMFHLGRDSGKVSAVPRIKLLVEDNVRIGFVEDATYSKLANECSKQGGLWMRAMFECGYTFGWRKQELLKMRVSQIDLSRRTIRLEPGSTKNMKGREVTMTDNIFEMISECVRGKIAMDNVFTRDENIPVRSFRGLWENICEAAGCPDLLFHDLRRTAARNLRRAGVDRSTIKSIGGWLTDKVFERYSIVDQADIKDAILKLETDRNHTLSYDSVTIHKKPEPRTVN